MSQKPLKTSVFEKDEFENFTKMMKDTGESAEIVAEKMNSKTTPSIVAYAKTTDVANMSLEGYENYLQTTNQSLTTTAIKSKLAAVGMGLLNTVASMGVSILASLVIQDVITFFDDLIVTQKELAEAAQLARNNIEELSSTISSNQDVVTNYGKRFAELAQGVNTFTGENLSLSDGEYEEFLSISNQLADIFPELERNYNSNGDAIVQLSGNVDSIVGSLDDLIDRQKQLANLTVADNMPKIFDGVKSNVAETKSNIDELEEELKEVTDQQKESMAKFYSSYEIPLSDNGKFIQKVFKSTNTVDYKRLTAELDKLGVEYSSKTFALPGDTSTSYIQLDFDISDEELERITSEAKLKYEKLGSEYTEQLNNLRQKIETEKQKINDEYDSMEKYIASWLSTDNHYQDMSLVMQNVMQGIIDNFYWDNLNFDSWDDAAKYIRDNYLSVFSSGIDTEAIERLFDESMKQLSAKDYIAQVDQVEKDIQAQLKKKGKSTNFSLDFLVDQQQDVLKKVQNKLWIMPNGTSPLNNLVNSLSAEDLKIILELDVNGETSPEEIELLIEEYKKLVESANSTDLSPIHEELDKIQSAYQTVSNAVKEYEKNQSLSLDTVQSLLQLEDKYLAVLFDENGQLQLNTESYNNLTKAKLLQLQVGIIDNAIATVASLTSEDEAKRYLTESSLDLTSATWEEVEATIALARAELMEQHISGQDVTLRMKALEQLEESVKSKKKIFEEVENSIQNPDNFYGVNDGTEESDNMFDWAANSISNLNREIDNLRDKLESASLDEKKGIYAQLDEKNKELVEATKKAANEYEDAWNEKSASLSPSDKEKIMSGEVFEIEKIKDPERYAQLTEGQQAYEQWKTSEQEHEKAKQQRKSDSEAAKQNEEDIYASKRNKRNNKISFFDSQIQDIDNEIALSEAKGGSATEVQYRRKNSFLNEQLGLLNEDKEAAKAMRDTYDYGSDKWEEYNSQMQEAENNINENRIAQIENNKAILMLPVEQYEKLNEELQEDLEKLEKEKEIIETAISSASNIVQGQIDYYNDLKEATTDYYDDEIEKIQEKKDALTENNDAIQKQIDLEKAQYELSRARNQKNIKVLRNGEFVYEADQDAIRTAQEELDNQVYNNAIDDLDKQIEALQNKKDEALNDIDLQIESLQDYKEQIDGIVSKYQEMLNLQSLMTTFGADIVQRIMAGDTSVIDEMTTKHVDKSVEIDNKQAEIDSNNEDIKAIQDLVKEWEASPTKIEYAQIAIKKVTENNATELEATKKRTETVGEMAKKWSDTELSIKKDLGLINTNHTTATEEEKTILETRLKNIQSFASQASAELQSVQSTLAALQSAKAELDKESGGSGIAPDDAVGNSHSGMKLGYIGETSDSKDAFKYIALNELKPDEVPRILQIGEAVLTKLQQANIMQNMQSAFVSGIKYNIPKNNIQPIQRTYNINGDIVLQNVNDVQTLAQSIKNTFLTRLDQELYK